MSQRRYAAVVGAANIDIGGRSSQALIPRDSNPGTVHTSMGGVGRNIAHALTLLGVETGLVTALGADAGAQELRRSCARLGIDLSAAFSFPEAATSTYLFLADETGEMALAVSDMRVCDRLGPDFLADRLDYLNAAAAVVVDTNFPGETLAYLAENCRRPIFADAVSAAKCEKLRPILPRLHTLKVNALEAGVLTGADTAAPGGVERAAQALLDSGVGRVVVSLGPEGARAVRAGETVRLPTFPGEMKNATGCGDAFTAALVWAFLEGLDFPESVRAGLAAAAITLAGAETIVPTLSAQRVREIANL